jgi:hypothetical protein
MTRKPIVMGRKQQPKRAPMTSKATGAPLYGESLQEEIVVRGKRINRMNAEQLRKIETKILGDANVLSEKLRQIPSSKTLPSVVASRKAIEREHAAAIADLRALRSSPLLRNETDMMPTLPSTWWRGVSRVFRGR